MSQRSMRSVTPCLRRARRAGGLPTVAEKRLLVRAGFSADRWRLRSASAASGSAQRLGGGR